MNIDMMHDAFMRAVDSGDLDLQTVTGNELIACLVKRQVEKL